MLKKISKLMLVGFLSGSLLFVDFSAKGVMLQNAYADSLYGNKKSDPVANTSANTSLMTTPESSTTNSGLPGITNSNAVGAELGNKQTFKSDEISDFNLTSTLFMMGAGIVLSRMASCKMTLDMAIALGGAATFLAGEVQSFVRIKDSLKKYEIEYSDTKNEKDLKKQVDSFVKLRKSYEEAKKVSETKKTFQKAAAAVFVAAAAAAVNLYMAEQAGLKACSATLKGASSACQAAFSASCAAGGSCQYPLAAGGTGALTASAKAMINSIKEVVPGTSATKAVTTKAMDATTLAQINAAASQCPMVSPAIASCSSYMAIKETGNGVCPSAGVLFVNINQMIDGRYYLNPSEIMEANPTFLTKMIKDMIMPTAHADVLQAMGVAGNAAVKYVIATSKTLGLKMDLLLFNPKNRAILWGAFAGFAYAATAGTDNVIAKIDQNIAKIDEILNMHYSHGLGKELAESTNTQVTKPEGETVDKDAIKGQTNTGRVGNNNATSSSIAGSKNESITLPESLPCYTGENTKKCKSFSDTFAGMKNFDSLDAGTKKQLMDMATGLNGLNGTQTITGATLDSLNGISANAQALNKKLADGKKELKDAYTIKGKKESIDNIEKELNKDLLSIVTESAKQQNMTPRQLMASIQGLPVGSLNYDTKKNENVKEEDKLKTTSVGNFTGDALLDDASLKGLNALDENNKEGIVNDGENGLQLTSGRDDAKNNAIDLSEYDINDISKSGNNIFDVITNRYQKSAYSRLFPKIAEKVNTEKEEKKK